MSQILDIEEAGDSSPKNRKRSKPILSGNQETGKRQNLQKTAALFQPITTENNKTMALLHPKLEIMKKGTDDFQTVKRYLDLWTLQGHIRSELSKQIKISFSILKIFLFRFIYFMHLNVLLVYMQRCHVCAWCPRKTIVVTEVEGQLVGVESLTRFLFKDKECPFFLTNSPAPPKSNFQQHWVLAFFTSSQIYLWRAIRFQNS